MATGTKIAETIIPNIFVTPQVEEYWTPKISTEAPVIAIRIKKVNVVTPAVGWNTTSKPAINCNKLTTWRNNPNLPNFDSNSKLSAARTSRGRIVESVPFS